MAESDHDLNQLRGALQYFTDLRACTRLLGISLPPLKHAQLPEVALAFRAADDILHFSRQSQVKPGVHAAASA